MPPHRPSKPPKVRKAQPDRAAPPHPTGVAGRVARDKKRPKSRAALWIRGLKIRYFRAEQAVAKVYRSPQARRMRRRWQVRLGRWRRWLRLSSSRRMLALGLLTTYALTAWGLDRYGQRTISGQFDAVVVAGCRVMPSGRPSPALAHRVRRAVALYEEGHAPRLVFTGGVGDFPPSEAQAAANLAISLGVPATDILLEDRSTSTEENARFAAELLRPDASIVVVSSAYHVFRCERVFGRHFGQVVGAGAIEGPSPRIRGALREVLAVVSYGVLGRL